MGEATQDELDPKRASVEAALELEQLDVNLFRSVRLWKPLPSSRAVFGGQIIGQSLAAAARTVKDAALSVHSLHSYFIRPGDNSLAAVYYVRRVRDGHSFAARQVTAQQGGVSIFEALVSFHRAEASTLDYQDTMPLDVPPADSLPTRQENWQKLLDTKRDKMPKAMVDFVEARIRAPFPLDMRNCDPSIEGFTMRTRRRPREPKQRLWIRAAQRLSDEPISHACVAAYASDYHMINTASLAAPEMFAMAASLDHSMWFHAPFRADEWMLYELSSSRAGGSRALISGRLFRPDGMLVCSLAQEGLVRFAAPSQQPSSTQPRPRL
mmetsp:Transcript_143750/g.460101  ORF Transcript_143750/g.460101 Transcript_143750/m.460101 type:complete len:324 (+) Transcript_143750:135-1106(+)